MCSDCIPLDHQHIQACLFHFAKQVQHTLLPDHVLGRRAAGDTGQHIPKLLRASLVLAAYQRAAQQRQHVLLHAKLI